MSIAALSHSHICGLFLAQILLSSAILGGGKHAQPPAEPAAETAHVRDEAKDIIGHAAKYHAQCEYRLSYRLYSRGVGLGRIRARDFYRVLRDDALGLDAAYPERRMTVLRDDGRNPAYWPVVKIWPEDKARIWGRKGVTPKTDWLTKREWIAETTNPKGCAFATRNERPALTLEECRRTLARYDLLRDHVQALLDGTEERLVCDAPGDADLESLRRDLLGLKEKIRKARTRFVSYTLVSPFLAETVRLRLIAGDNFFQMLLNHRANAGRRLDAVSMLALACHKDILMSCTEDVRIQFCDVVSGLKRISRPAEWEHFKTVTTMLDSYDPAKKRGADAWWE